MKKIKLSLVLCGIIFNTFYLIANDYNIANYGAINDTSVLSTDAINRAVEHCFANGGGRVIVPPGDYKSGTIVLKDNVEFHLQAGATLFAGVTHEDFPRQRQPEYRSQKDPGGWYALLYAQGAENISITGLGTIDGQGAKQMPRPGALKGDLNGRPRNILFISCRNILVEGVTMRNAGIWNQHYLDCEDVIVNNIKVYNHSNRNNDGIDIDGCRRFILSNSIIDSDDDAIVLKSTGTAPCEDITITNCIVSTNSNAIKCGTESTGGFKNITISNCIVRPTHNIVRPQDGYDGITGIALQIVDGGIMEGVSISNIVIDGMRCPIFIRLGNRARKHVENAPEPEIGSMKNIRIDNITAFNSGNFSSSITGIPGSKIENLYLSNIRIVSQGGLKSGEYKEKISDVIENEKGYPRPNIWGNLPSSGLFVRHVKDISLSGISFSVENPDPRPTIVASDVDNLRMQDIDISGLVNQKEIWLESVGNLKFDPELKSKITRK